MRAGGAEAGKAAGVAGIAAGRAALETVDALVADASVSGPFCPQADSSKPMVTIRVGATRSRTRRTRLSNCSDIDRILLTMPTDSTLTPLTDSEFRAQAGAVLANIEGTVDRWLQQDVIDIDASRTGGLLELSFPNGSKIVVNTQPPLHELWLAGRSGGFHFKHVDGRWLDTRSGVDFYAALSACATEQGGVALTFGAA